MKPVVPLPVRLMRLLFVPRCVCCGVRLAPQQSVFCDRCLAQYNSLKAENCPDCARILSSCTCSFRFLRRGRIRVFYKVFRYYPRHPDSPASQVLYALKQRNSADAERFLAREVADCLLAHIPPQERGQCVLCCIPRSHAAIHRFGYDHAARLTKRVSRLTGIPQRRLLVRRRTGAAQKALTLEQRMKNTRNLFVVPGRFGRLKGAGVRYLLLDDIVTTGASMIAGARALRAAGARRIEAVAVATAHREQERRIYRCKPIKR